MKQEFELSAATALLERTPALLDSWLRDLPDKWIHAREEDGWTAFEIVGHLISGDRSDWIPRARRILKEGTSLAFEPFDRTAQERLFAGESLEDLLDEFAAARGASLAALAGLGLQDADFDRRGLHPDFNEVTLRQLLATWVVHDQSHIAQIARVLAKEYRDAVGPWRLYLPLLDRA